MFESVEYVEYTSANMPQTHHQGYSSGFEHAEVMPH